MIRKYQRKKMSFLKEMALYQNLQDGEFKTAKGSRLGTSGTLKIGDKIYNYVMNRCTDDQISDALGDVAKSSRQQKSYMYFNQLLVDLGIMDRVYRNYGPVKISNIRLNSIASKIKILNNFFDSFNPDEPCEILFDALDDSPQVMEEEIKFSPFIILNKVKSKMARRQKGESDEAFNIRAQSSSDEAWNTLLMLDKPAKDSNGAFRRADFIIQCLAPYAVSVFGTEAEKSALTQKSKKDSARYLAQYADNMDRRADFVNQKNLKELEDNLGSENDLVSNVRKQNNHQLLRNAAEKQKMVNNITGYDEYLDNDGEFKIDKLDPKKVEGISEAANYYYFKFLRAYESGISFLKYVTRLRTTESAYTTLNDPSMEEIKDLIYDIDDEGTVETIKSAVDSKFEEIYDNVKIKDKKHSKNVIEEALEKFFVDMQRKTGKTVIRPVDFFEYQIENDGAFLNSISNYNLSESDLTEEEFPTWKSLMDYFYNPEGIRRLKRRFGAKEKAGTQSWKQADLVNVNNQKIKKLKTKLLLLQAELNGETEITINQNKKVGKNIEEVEETVEVNGGFENPYARMDDEEYFEEKEAELENIETDIEDLKNEKDSFNRVKELADKAKKIRSIIKNRKRDEHERYLIPLIEELKSEIDTDNTQLLKLYDEIIDSAHEENTTALALQRKRNKHANELYQSEDDNKERNKEYCITFKIETIKLRKQEENIKINNFIKNVYLQYFQNKEAKLKNTSLNDDIKNDIIIDYDNSGAYTNVTIIYPQSSALYREISEDNRKGRKMITSATNLIKTKGNIVDVIDNSIRINIDYGKLGFERLMDSIN